MLVGIEMNCWNDSAKCLYNREVTCLPRAKAVQTPVDSSQLLSNPGDHENVPPLQRKLGVSKDWDTNPA